MRKLYFKDISQLIKIFLAIIIVKFCFGPLIKDFDIYGPVSQTQILLGSALIVTLILGGVDNKK